MCPNWTGYIFSDCGPQIGKKKLQKWSAIQLEYEISWLLMVKVDGNLLERLFLFIIRFKIFQVPFALFFNNSSLFHNREILLDVESGAVCSYILEFSSIVGVGKFVIFIYNLFFFLMDFCNLADG